MAHNTLMGLPRGSQQRIQKWAGLPVEKFSTPCYSKCVVRGPAELGVGNAESQASPRPAAGLTRFLRKPKSEGRDLQAAAIAATSTPRVPGSPTPTMK